MAGLRLLVATIEEKDELDRLKKASFLYYLLKDFDRAHPGSEFASHYAFKSLIQPSFCSLMDGLYALDNFDFEVRPFHRRRTIFSHIDISPGSDPSFDGAFGDTGQSS